MSRYHLTKAILYFMEAMLFFLKHSCLDTEDGSCCQTFGSILLTSMAITLNHNPSTPPGTDQLLLALSSVLSTDQQPYLQTIVSP